MTRGSAAHPSRLASLCAALTLVASCAGRQPAHAPPVPSRPPAALTLAGELNIPPLTRFPPAVGVLFGGISGLAPMAQGREMLAVSDDRAASRVFRLAVSVDDGLHVRVLDVIPLQRGNGAPETIDPEGIALTPAATMIVASEGIGNAEPRLPPALIEYTLGGRFIRQLEVRARYVPNPTGPLASGVRDNTGFESLTMAPGGRRLFTGTETALVQDGEPATFERGTLARILEYVASDGTYRPAREFAYPIEPVPRPAFRPGFAINGLVELLATSDTDLLALERAWVGEADDGPRGLTRIRLFRISLAGATDISGVDSLRDGDGVIPVSKELILDLGDVSGLSPELAALDNFEGLAFGPRLADGSPTVLIVSDDNFSEQQRTSFLLFRY